MKEECSITFERQVVQTSHFTMSTVFKEDVKPYNGQTQNMP